MQFFLGKLTLLRCAAALLELLPLSLPAAAASTPTKDKIELFYDADPKLCGTFAAVVNRLHRQHPKAIYLGEVRNSFFDHTGFSRPPWIDHSEEEIEDFGDPAPYVPMFRGQGSGYWSGGAFFHGDVANDGQQRLVFVEHREIGHHGDYQVSIWVFKPGMHYRQVNGPGARFGRQVGDEIVTGIDPDTIDLLVDFSDPQPPYPSVRIPNQRIGFLEEPVVSDGGKKLLGSSFIGEIAQEVFLFNKNTYFAVRTPLFNYGLIYRITHEMTAEIVCMTTYQRMLDELKKTSRFWK
ncbi:hypothetical protein [Methylocapsa acidiphila]|uniref:hypothetical protein n=1 Tax=Methylocapsa acidiphila TaxID=133552 RepID=UPI000413901C|nr:hypothetical protein [Methylocapsa acidiphila]